MKYTYDVIVIGAGLMGCSVAFQLASRGIKTAVIERNSAPGLETTARSGAIIRAHYGVPELVAMAQAANKRFLNFADEVGSDCGFTQSGYMVIVDQDDVSTLKANIAMQRDLGVDASLLPASSISELVPSLIVDDIALAAYEPLAGFANPAKTVQAYADKAVALGATFYYFELPRSTTKTHTGWEVLLSGGDTLSGDHVILSTGNWSPQVASLFGIDLPVAPVRAQIVVVDRPDGTKPMPVVSDLINLAYFRQEADGGMWVGSSDMTDLQEKLEVPDGFNEVADEGSISNALSKTTLRFKSAGEQYNGSVQRSFTGLYETTPDWQPIIDTLPNNLQVSVGFSGHGFKLAPVIGDIMADAVEGKTPVFDTSIFRLGRFAANQPVKSRYTYQRAKFLR